MGSGQSLDQDVVMEWWDLLNEWGLVGEGEMDFLPQVLFQKFKGEPEGCGGGAVR